MNRTELTAKVAKKSGIATYVVEKVLPETFEVIKEALIEGEKVTISGFGTFESKTRAEYIGRNPSTGENIVIPEQKIPYFKPSKVLKEAVNNKG